MKPTEIRQINAALSSIQTLLIEISEIVNQNEEEAEGFNVPNNPIPVINQPSIPPQPQRQEYRPPAQIIQPGQPVQELKENHAEKFGLDRLFKKFDTPGQTQQPASMATFNGELPFEQIIKNSILTLQSKVKPLMIYNIMYATKLEHDQVKPVIDKLAAEGFITLGQYGQIETR